MTTRAKGTFEITMYPEPPYDTRDGVTLGRIGIDKVFAGDLVATSRVEMLSARNLPLGSGAYVAIERVEGTLSGRRGSFVLRHLGTMNRGAPELSIAVVPDTATGELRIDIVDGRHFYSFDYQCSSFGAATDSRSPRPPC